MEQLSMIRNNVEIKEIYFPEGYSMRTYQKGDELGWCECCIDGSLGVDGVSEAVFHEKMLCDESVNPNNIFFLISPGGEIAGTITYQYTKENDVGNIHMVGIPKKYTGKKLAFPMTLYAINKIVADGKKKIMLTTDDWRLPAIKTYLRAGFEPIQSTPDMEERWNKVMVELL